MITIRSAALHGWGVGLLSEVLLKGFGGQLLAARECGA
jgi:hypothetical protein